MASKEKKVIEGELVSASDETYLPADRNISIPVVVEKGFIQRTVDQAILDEREPYFDPLVNEITYAFKKNYGLVRSSGVLTRVQRVVFNILAWNAAENLKKRKMHKIQIREILDILENNSIRSGTYRQFVLTTLEALRLIRLQIFTDGDLNSPNETVTSILSEYVYKEDTGEIYYSFPNIAAELLASTGFASQVDLKIQADIESRHALALMEICQPYESEGATPYFTVDEWKRFFGVSEVETYRLYKYFHEKLLRRAVAELREQKIMLLTLETKRAARRITHLRFVFENSDEARNSKLYEQMQIHKHPAYKRLRDLGVTSVTATQAVQNDPVHAIEVAEAAEKKYRAGELKSLSGWVAHMLINKHPVKSEFERKVEAEKAKATRTIIRKKKIEEDSGEKIALEEQKFISLEVDTYLNSLKAEDIIEMANVSLKKRAGSPDARKLLSDALKSVYSDDERLDPASFNEIVRNSALRSYAYAIVDPGGLRLKKHMTERFGQQVQKLI